MFRALFIAVAVLLNFSGPSSARPAPSSGEVSPVGLWLTEDRGGVIEIYGCGEGRLCGRIVGMIDPFDNGRPRTDVAGRPRCGLTLMEGFVRSARDSWSDGRITNPEDGKTYGAEMTVADAERLRLRGYLWIPLLGATQVWTRYTGPLTEDCRMG